MKVHVFTLFPSFRTTGGAGAVSSLLIKDSHSCYYQARVPSTWTADLGVDQKLGVSRSDQLARTRTVHAVGYRSSPALSYKQEEYRGSTKGEEGRVEGAQQGKRKSGCARKRAHGR